MHRYIGRCWGWGRVKVLERWKGRVYRSLDPYDDCYLN